MKLKLNDTGLLVEFLNYKLGISESYVTEVTLQRLKQFQCAYRQTYIDYDSQNIASPNYNPYSYYYQPGDDINNFDENAQYLFPNGELDIYTLSALLNIDIENTNTHKIAQIQNCLSKSKYYMGVIAQSGVYDDITITAIRNFQQTNNIYQPYISITENKNLLSNIPSFYTITASQYSCISGLIPISPNNVYYIKSHTTNKVMISYYYSLEQEINSTTIDSWFSSSIAAELKSLMSPVIQGKIPAQVTNNSTNTIKYIKVTIINSTSASIAQNVNEFVGKSQIQLELNDAPTSYEPYSYNIYNTFCSGKLNIPTYNALKREFNLEEVW